MTTLAITLKRRYYYDGSYPSTKIHSLIGAFVNEVAKDCNHGVTKEHILDIIGKLYQ